MNIWKKFRTKAVRQGNFLKKSIQDNRARSLAERNWRDDLVQANAARNLPNKPQQTK